MRIAIVGGGVMGCMSALRLAQSGAEVIVLERSVPGAEASSAAAGILAPSVEAHHAAHSAKPTATLRLGLQSRELHARLAEELRNEHGMEIGFYRCGVMRVAMNAEELADLRRHAKLLADVPHELLTAEETLQLEPSISPDVLGGLFVSGAAQLEPRRLLRAIAAAAERAGARFRRGALVNGIRIQEDSTGQRASAVKIGSEEIEADHIIVAAGSWTHLIPGVDLGIDLDRAQIHPVRGQLAATLSRPPVFQRVIFGGSGYILTRPDGRVLCGSTEELAGYRREVTFSGALSILKNAVELAPSLADAPLLDHWSSFRPGTSDGLPLVGETALPGLSLAAGHFRNGILLAPMTAEVLVSSILDGEVDESAAAIDPKRFSKAMQ